MRLALRDELPFVTVTVSHLGLPLEIPNMLVDTGSASTLLSADLMANVGIVPAAGDRIRRLRGVGGHEFVFTRRLERLLVGGHAVDDFEVEIGGMDYGFDIGGILGMDFLSAAGAVLNLRALTLEFM